MRDGDPMIQLALLRHGVAEDAGPASGWRDEPRALTPRGRRRMEAAAAGIARLGLAARTVVTSPLVRCAQTAEIVAAALGAKARTDDRLRPGMEIAGLLDLVLEHPDAPGLLVCGHQPDLSEVTADLVGGWVEFRKGGLAVIDLDEPRARGGRLTALYPPAALRRLGTAPA